MKPHVKGYYQHFDLTIADRIICEVPGCGAQAVDICHINRTGMGGNNADAQKIENWMAKCRVHHEKYGDKIAWKAQLYVWHKAVLEALGKPFNREWIDDAIKKYS